MPLAERGLFDHIEYVAKKSIPLFHRFVISIAVLLASPSLLPAQALFAVVEYGTLVSVSDNLDFLPQERRSVSVAASLAPEAAMRVEPGLRAFIVEPSIPAGYSLSRGFSGIAVDLAFFVSELPEDGKAVPFVSIAPNCSLSRYTDTDLAFLAFGVSAALGISQRKGRTILRASLPLSVELRGDALSFSAGLRFELAPWTGSPRRVEGNALR